MEEFETRLVTTIPAIGAPNGKTSIYFAYGVFHNSNWKQRVSLELAMAMVWFVLETKSLVVAIFVFGNY